MKVEKCAARTRAWARSSASAEGERGVWSTKARAASICIRPRAMEVVMEYLGVQVAREMVSLIRPTIRFLQI